jgi:type II secretory pathway pseudopilin PulG
MERHTNFQGGQMIVELLVAFGLASILLPAIMTGFVSGSSGKVQQQQRLKAIGYLEEGVEGVRSVREAGWANIVSGVTYHLVANGSGWGVQQGTETLGDFTRSIVITDVTPSDSSIKMITVTVTWNNIIPSNVSTIFYLTRYLGNKTYTQTTQADFNAGTLNNVQVTNVSGGEVKLANNNKAKWCQPAFTTDKNGQEVTITLPDGPPVAVAAYASATSSAIPNDVFVAVAPDTTTSAKLAYLNVTANTDPPVPTLKGTFTLDPAKYSSPDLVPSGINLTNNFKTTDVKYYRSGTGKIYALLGTDLPDHEVVVVQVYNGATDSFQDPVNKIYKYWTFFNTRQYQGDARSTPNQDQAPFGYGAVSLQIYNNKGYLLSGGYLYTFDLNNIDSKTPASGLDMVGCRIQLDGYDCQPGNGTDMKYNAGETGASWGDTTPPAHNNCSDGGNIELYADHQLAAVTSAADGHTYVFVAVGAGTNPELDIIDVTTVPTSSTNPKINNSSCGRISGGASGWKEKSSLDFNSASGTEEAANSVYVRSDSNRVYMSSNGGIDGNHDGKPDSDQFYVIDTTNKSSPKFLSGTPSTGAQSGYYNGDATNIQLFPRRSLTVLSGQRAIIVGQDGFPADQIEPKEYQVLNIETEATPTYCAGVSYLPGFNDLTSVSEADGDNFVYMVANTMEKQLKIIQGGPDTGIYVDSGNFEANPLSLATPSAFNRFVANVFQPTNTTIRMQVSVATPSGGLCVASNFNYVGPGGDTNAFYTPVGSTISGTFPLGAFGNYQNPERCFGYKALLDITGGDYNQTPVLNDMTVNYSP